MELMMMMFKKLLWKLMECESQFKCKVKDNQPKEPGDAEETI
jgi:hypothetical protein